ncbi:hypothetical protein TrRE_jg9151 [Triparma retinervis]|uniref:WW domain-containing protein n=1 Tax=Triparma retinervis TaxID=2557542 RepID=A0A9W6ZCE6_9STRA|nr:hypothetical protein TrRE_jg9151 [Triparma retinervis]
MDEWKAAEAPPTGRTYYYNRRTSEARWVLPENVVFGMGGRLFSPKSSGKKEQNSKAEFSQDQSTGNAVTVSSGSDEDEDLAAFITPSKKLRL